MSFLKFLRNSQHPILGIHRALSSVISACKTIFLPREFNRCCLGRSQLVSDVNITVLYVLTYLMIATKLNPASHVLSNIRCRPPACAFQREYRAAAATCRCTTVHNAIFHRDNFILIAVPIFRSWSRWPTSKARCHPAIKTK